MGPREVALRLRKKWREFRDIWIGGGWSEIDLSPDPGFPNLPDKESVPLSFRDALQRDAGNLAQGKWRAFGHLDLQVGTPPNWSKDYLAGVDIATSKSAFALNHRVPPGGVDIKLIWELSRWFAPVRMAQACWLLESRRCGELCLDWLEDWTLKNPPFSGWNWTSALEPGIRLIQFTWIDALLTAFEGKQPSEFSERLAGLCRRILPAHFRFVWQHGSFGSSANNHLLGELSGLILSLARWPDLSKQGVELDSLHASLEREVLSQFAPDGGNREQALNYQLFAWEFCWQARAALRASGRKTSVEVDGRLAAAARFFGDMQIPADPWDFGDSDDAFVTPFFIDERRARQEWWHWFQGNDERAEGIVFWWGTFERALPEAKQKTPVHDFGGDSAGGLAGWRVYGDSGYAVNALGHWKARLDFSPLGYLSTAAHGHLDALHLSLWLGGAAMVVDPGTGAYYGDPMLRRWLASHEAHNGPAPVGVELARRAGPFLWEIHHTAPVWEAEGNGIVATLKLCGGVLRRSVIPLQGGDEGWVVGDSFEPAVGQPGGFRVRWQFAPDCVVEKAGPEEYRVHRDRNAMRLQLGGEWGESKVVMPTENEAVNQHKGVVSPRFRETKRAPCLELSAPSDEPCVCSTTFLACRAE